RAWAVATSQEEAPRSPQRPQRAQQRVLISSRARSGCRDPLTRHIAEGDRIRVILCCLPQLGCGIDDQRAMFLDPVVNPVLKAAQENDLPAAQDNLWECHPTSYGLPGRRSD